MADTKEAFWRKTLLIKVLIVKSVLCFAQSSITLFGYVRDAENQNPLVGAFVYTDDLTHVTYTNNEGYYFFSVSLDELPVDIVTSYVAHVPDTFSLSIDIRGEVIHSIFLEQRALQEIVVQGVLNNNSAQVNKANYSAAEIQSLPALMGEVDVVKALTILPGVSPGQEGRSDFIVRGGDISQNLIIYDDIPLYSSGHLMGFVSSLNPYAVKTVNAYKGKFPAQFTGRLSSVIDIISRNGDMRKTSAKLDVGVINFNLGIDGPLVKDKLSYALNVRAAGLPLLVMPFKRGYEKGKYQDYFNYSMYDANLKLHWKINDKNYLSSTILTGADNFFLGQNYDFDQTLDEFRFDWSNVLTSIKYHGQIKPWWFLKTGIYYTSLINPFEYRYIDTDEQVFDWTGTAHIRDVSDLSQYGIRNDNEIRLGIDSRLKAGIHYSQFESQNNRVDQEFKSFEDTLILLSEGIVSAIDHWNVYAEILSKWQNWNYSAGLSANMYNHSTRRSYSLEPRIHLSNSPNKHITWGVTYATLSQPLHQIEATFQGFSQPMWTVAQRELPIAKSKNFSIYGLYSWDDKGWNAELALFYRTFEGLSTLPTGASQLFQLNSSLIDKIVSPGTGRAHGVEIALIKNAEKTRGRLGVTLLKSDRSFFEINEGERFSADYERPYEVNIQISHSFARKNELTLIGYWAKGNPYTLPSAFGVVGSTDFSQSIVPSFLPYDFPDAIFDGSKNNSRLRNTLRFDVLYRFHRYDDKGCKKHSWSLGMYNMLFHNNPAFIFFDTTTIDNKRIAIQAKQVTLFKMVPFITYHKSFVF